MSIVARFAERSRWLLILLCLVGRAARADVLPVGNGSFEAPALGRDGQQATNAIEGWTIEGVAGVFVNNGAYGNKMEGADSEQLVWINGTKAGSIAQVIAPKIQALTVYSVTAAIGLRKDTPLTNGASLLLRLQAFDDADEKFARTLGIKEVLLGREQLSDEKLNDFTATFTSGVVPAKGSLRILISTGELGKDRGDWTIDNVRVEAKPAPADVAARLESAAEPRSFEKKASAKSVRYNRDIRPILSENCFVCHGPDSASRKAGLRLDRFAEATAKRKDSEPAIVPGDLSRSEAMRRILTKDEDDVMPPPKSKKKLTAKQIELIRTWIAQGAEYELHWAYQPPLKSAPPAVKNVKWACNDIDRFILARLEREGITPAPEADARTLARRVALDLTGLPPTPEMVDTFLKDKSAKAYENYVDRLLSSSAWGEHRGRYWLDAARYADTHGIHFDNYREMWTFREWVIKAFNRNLPFDQFTVEQLAGDLLPNPTLEQQIASGFNRCNITSNEGGLIDEEYLVLYMKDRTEAVSQIFMGTSAMCAGCHDHKFDPLTTKEYYSLAAFFNNSTAPSRDGNKKDPAPVVVVPTEVDRVRWFALEKETPVAKERVDNRRKEARPEYEKWTPVAQPLADAIPTQGLLLSAPLTSAKGTNVHFKVNGEERTEEVATNQTWIDGHVAAKAFQSSSDFKLKLGDVGDFEKDASWSYGAWVRIEDKEGAGGLIARMDEKNSFRGWDLYLDKDRPVAHFVNKWPDNAVRVASKTRIEPKKWTHVFVTYDGSEKASGVKIFVNGKIAETDADDKKLTDTIRNTVPLTIAHRSDGAVVTNVGLQDVRIYSRTLKAEEVAGIARNTHAAWLAGKTADAITKEERDELYPAWLAVLDKPFMKEAATLATLEQEDRDIRARGSVAHVFKEKESEATAYVLYRGEYDRRRDRVLAMTPEFLPPMAEELPRNRLGLARWLVSPQHPLTARVAVNRFWQEVFGTGLVRTAGDFGVSGELPSHPELFDWLAVDFMENSWDVKRFFKQIVMSATYRQSAVTTPETLLKDPQNRLLARAPHYRMDAEMVRDYALAASGLLVNKIGGPSVKPYQPEGVWEAVAMKESDTHDYHQDHGDALYRRSMYTFWKRSAPPASMDIFNAPSRETCTMRRERTDTPLQALVTLNDTQFIEAARHLAERAMKEAGKAPRQRLNYVAERLLARPLRPEELKVCESILDDLLKNYREHKDDAEALLAVGESKYDPRANKSELAAYTMAVNQLMNLDEILTK
jgi:mono/diheme cytochrome c family protein